MQKTKDNLHSEQAALKKRLKFIMGEVQMQESKDLRLLSFLFVFYFITIRFIF